VDEDFLLRRSIRDPRTRTRLGPDATKPDP